jgi:hypothetical protein
LPRRPTAHQLADDRTDVDAIACGTGNRLNERLEDLSTARPAKSPAIVLPPLPHQGQSDPIFREALVGHMIARKICGHPF